MAGCATDGKKKGEAADPQAAHLLELEAAASAHPADARAQYTLGNAYFDAQRYADARGAYQRATEIEPDFADAHTNLGLVHRLEGNLPASISEYEKALAIAPGDLVTRRNLAVALATAERLPEAAAQLAELSSRVPDDLDVVRELATLYRTLERYSDAEAAYTKLLALSPGEGDAWFALGECQRAQGNTSGAIISWNRAVALNSDYAAAHAALAVVYTETGDYIRAWRSVRETQRLGGYMDPMLVSRLQELSGQLGPE